ncbi:aspartyl/asparaginyl beta-hydroxylase domain-containing protein [Streptomyces sp. NPDC050560]|uniref:aspartyl/asparaginyl beta-hydroxylase domain-containing protein n=1 Tax=Streptomyces sp. NPDC050560 TaxID=3365630 RepID=UPI0037AE07AA
MTPDTEDVFARIKEEHGRDSLARVEKMLEPGRGERHPLQRNARWILPGISPTPWHDPYGHDEIVAFARELESQHGAIKAELADAWARRRADFHDYQHYLRSQQDWQALHLYRDGAQVPQAARIMPTASRVLREYAVDTGLICPLLECHFSTLLPGAVVPAHCDLWNFTINLHLAVDIPPGCLITVAGESRSWVEGRCLLFDYSFEHEARNDGDRPRTCLLADLWHPETTLPERMALTTVVREVRRLLDGA